MKKVSVFKNILFESIFKGVITEGGNAVKNVSRIQLNCIKPTLDKFISLIFLPLFPSWSLGEEIFVLGSTGKKKDSGDLDLGIDYKYNAMYARIN